jgi:hypothetical protein
MDTVETISRDIRVISQLQLSLVRWIGLLQLIQGLNTSRKYETYNLLQKAIVKNDAMKYDNTHAANNFNIKRDTLCRWTQKSKYAVHPDAAAPPPESNPPRPTKEIFHLKPEERNVAENKIVFERYAHKDVDTFKAREDFEISADPEGDDTESQDSESGGEVEDVYWSKVFDGTLVSQDQLDQHYTSQYLQLAFDSDIPDHLKMHVERSVNAALEHNTEYRAPNTNTAWDPKKRSFVV